MLLKLDLSPTQKDRIERYDADWRSYRDSVRREVGGMQAKVESGPRSVPQLNTNLQGYAELSREYDRTREAIWQKAFDELNEKQKSVVLEWQKEGVN